MKRRVRAPSPALVISLIALFVALGGTTAYASGLISGRQIVDHSIPAKKLTAAAVSALQGGGAISLHKDKIPADSFTHALAVTHGIAVYYMCESGQRIHFSLYALHDADDLYVSGTYAQDGVLTSVQGQRGLDLGNYSHRRLNIDVIAWIRHGDHKVVHIDLGGYNSGDLCYIRGLITPGP